MHTKLHVFQAKVQKEITSDQARLLSVYEKTFLLHHYMMSFENA